MSATVFESFYAVPYADGTVLTNGCFDLLHVGHVRLLERAAMFGRRLVVAVNTDCSVEMLKGQGRPINKLADRIYMLACLDCVDVVIGFPDNLPNVIHHVLPHCWVKGAPYTMDSLNKEEVQAAREVGAAIIILEKFGDYSTTGILRRLQNEPTCEPCPNCGSTKAFGEGKPWPGPEKVALICPDCGSIMKPKV